VIELEGVGKAFQVGEHQVHALADIDERIDEGEHVSIMGPSGSGKSTLLNVIGCLAEPTSGRLSLDGRDVSGLGSDGLAHIRQDLIGFVFQSYQLISRLDALGNVELPMIFAGVPRGERIERATELLRLVGLEDRMHHRPNEMSGGQQQRVAIARAIIMNPRILLADEPTGNLDTQSGNQILDLLDELNDKGLTIIVVTHDPAVARRSDRILILRDGRIARRVSGSEATDLASLFGEPAT